QPFVHLDEVGALTGELIDRPISLVGISYDNRKWPDRWVAVQDRAAGEGTRPSYLTIEKALAHLEHPAGVACVANRRNPITQVHQEEVQGVRATALRWRIVHVHVDQTG